MAAGCHLGFDLTRNSTIQSAEPKNSTQHEVNWITRRGDIAIQNFPRWWLVLPPWI